MNTIPNRTDDGRDRATDLATLKTAMFKDLLGQTGALTNHVMEGGDPLYGYIDEVLGVTLRVNWVDVSDMELALIQSWQKYTLSLFDEVVTS